MRTDFTINNEPYVTLKYGDVEIKLGLTMLHYLPGMLLSGMSTEHSFWQELQDLALSITDTEALMWKSLEKGSE